MRVLMAAIVGTAALSAALSEAAAQPYPNRPIKMVVPFAPGGADVMARLVGDQITAVLGQPVVIENPPGGAGGTGGTQFVTTPHPHGYTLTPAPPRPLPGAAAVHKN